MTKVKSEFHITTIAQLPAELIILSNILNLKFSSFIQLISPTENHTTKTEYKSHTLSQLISQ